MRLSCLVLTLSLAAAPAFAKPVTYLCKLNVSKANNWVPEQVVIQHDAATGAVLINDPVINHFVGHPIEGQVKTDNAKRITFGWTLERITNGSQTISKFLYSATYIKANQTVSVAAVPPGYSNHFTAQGKCSIE